MIDVYNDSEIDIPYRIYYRIVYEYFRYLFEAMIITGLRQFIDGLGYMRIKQLHSNIFLDEKFDPTPESYVLKRIINGKLTPDPTLKTLLKLLFVKINFKNRKYISLEYNISKRRRVFYMSLTNNNLDLYE